MISVGDSYPRDLKVHLITDDIYLIYDGTVDPNNQHKENSLTYSQVLVYFGSATKAQLGIVLTTYVGYWKFTGKVNMVYRTDHQKYYKPIYLSQTLLTI